MAERERPFPGRRLRRIGATHPRPAQASACQEGVKRRDQRLEYNDQRIKPRHQRIKPRHQRIKPRHQHAKRRDQCTEQYWWGSDGGANRPLVALTGERRRSNNRESEGIE